MNDFSNDETTKHEPAHVMKTPIHSPILKTAVLSLACATPTLAVLVPSIFPSHADLQAPSSAASPPVASAGFHATFNRMKKEALLAKHDLLSEVNRVGLLEYPIPLAEGGFLTTQTATQAAIAPPSGITGRTAEPVAGQPHTPEIAALSNTSVKAQRPSGLDRRKFGKRNRGSFVV